MKAHEIHWRLTLLNKVSINGSTMTLKDWSSHIGIKYATLLTRLHRGWSVEKMLSTTTN